MMELRGAQRKYLRGLANLMQPIVYIGKNGLSGAVIAAIDEGMDDHELVKIKFLVCGKTMQVMWATGLGSGT